MHLASYATHRTRQSSAAIICGNSIIWLRKRHSIPPLNPKWLKLLTYPPLCFRNTLGLLGGEGYDAIAPDWIGHGDSSMPEAGFDCSEGAYLRAIGQFVEAVGIKQPLALVVHVCMWGRAVGVGYVHVYACKLQAADRTYARDDQWGRVGGGRGLRVVRVRRG